MSFLTITEIDLRGKRVLIRVDFNVPMQNGEITDDTRIRSALPTIQYAIQKAKQVILMSHLGRPEEGVYDTSASLAPIAQHLAKLLQTKVPLLCDWENAKCPPDSLLMLENVRFARGENANSEVLAKRLASFCDVFVMDAFGTAHRAQASTVGVGYQAPIACAGLLMASELEALHKALLSPKSPIVAIVGGSKVSSKLMVLRELMRKVDYLVVGGGIANTFLVAEGKPIGASLFEASLVTEAKDIIAGMRAQNKAVIMPVDARVAKKFSAEAKAEVKDFTQIAVDDLILDIGPKSENLLTEMMQNAGTILWNGPVGVFEFAAFAQGTQALAKAIAASKAYSLAGGGDTVAAIEQFQVAEGISYISTGGGAFLEFVEGKILPAVAMLEACARSQ